MNEVKVGEVQENDVFKTFEIGEQVKARYSGVWYNAVIKEVSYEKEQYKVSIPDRGIEGWLSSSELEATEGKKEDPKNTGTDENPTEEKKEKKKLKLKVPTVKLN